ncbi:hypothetical protein ACQKKK_07415 [Peribacillus sp. NPDC006672]
MPFELEWGSGRHHVFNGLACGAFGIVGFFWWEVSDPKVTSYE